jgi:hypothetical protein
VNRVRNADEFRLEFRRLCENYTYFFAPRVAAIRVLYAKTPTGQTPPAVDESLEAHVRSYLVNKPGQKIVYLSAEISDCVGST